MEYVRDQQISFVLLEQVFMTSLCGLKQKTIDAPFKTLYRQSEVKETQQKLNPDSNLLLSIMYPMKKTIVLVVCPKPCPCYLLIQLLNLLIDLLIKNYFACTTFLYYITDLFNLKTCFA